MYINRNYGFWMTFNWSKNPFIVGACYAASITLVEYFFDWKVVIPWQPVSIIGIAVAFYLGFKNNSSYDRTWEARKIWGSIVNSSRTFGSAVIAFVRSRDSEEVSAIHQEMILRHLGWLTALRYQLRLSRKWEHTEDRIKGFIHLLFVRNIMTNWITKFCNSFLRRSSRCTNINPISLLKYC